MTISQIRYFLEVAKQKNLSEAARHLYVSQPSLGRQMTSMETELNMQLFIRSNKGMVLTPAGEVLYTEWEKMITQYDRTVEKANLVSRGYGTTLKIGIISGIDVNDILSDIISYFEEKYSNVRITLQHDSFQKLLQKFYDKEFDIIISYDFHLFHRKDIHTLKICPYLPMWAIPTKNPLSGAKSLSYKDMENQKMVIVSETECEEGVELIINKFMEKGGYYPDFYFVQGMDDVYLWLNTTDKCAILNSLIYKIPNAKMVPIKDDDEEENNILLGWSDANDNYAVDLLRKYLARKG